jgi:hypothetical protein
LRQAGVAVARVGWLAGVLLVFGITARMVFAFAVTPWFDAKQVKVRDHGRVVSKALVVAYAVHETGLRATAPISIPVARCNTSPGLVGITKRSAY